MASIGLTYTKGTALASLTVGVVAVVELTYASAIASGEIDLTGRTSKMCFGVED